ncbi:MAG TPA: hypothetical protein VIV57_16955, partial [Anaeromyxobacter sp.]
AAPSSQDPTSSKAATASPAPAAPAPVSITRAVAAEPTGPSALSGVAETVIDPASSFHVEVSGRIADARLVLLDSADAHVPARSTCELGATTQLTLSPAAPLVPGSRYVLRVEGASRREVRDGDRSYAPLSFALLAAGTPPPPEPKRKPKSKSRKRR